MPLTLFFAPHVPAAISARFVMELTNSRILLVEQSWYEDYSTLEADWNKLAFGLLTPELMWERYRHQYRHQSKSYALNLFSSIHDSLKKIVIERSPFSRTEIDYVSGIDGNFSLEKPLTKALSELEMDLRLVGQVQRVRDKALAHQLKELLINSGNSKILVMRGNQHELSLPLFLAEIGIPCNRPIHPSEPWISPYSVNTVGRFIVGEKPPRKWILAMVAEPFMQREVAHDLKIPLTGDNLVSQNIIAAAVHNLDSMSEEDIEGYLSSLIKNSR